MARRIDRERQGLDYPVKLFLIPEIPGKLCPWLILSDKVVQEHYESHGDIQDSR